MAQRMANPQYQSVKYNFILTKADNHLPANYVENNTRHVFERPLITKQDLPGKQAG
ncbi:hypothetical protein [Pontibacter sp. BT731]|uniref:hypothetical protein n=1 Tax=Pontibacter coccineus TaxID=3063328 RepID=UPI0026E455F9|nr:hypothetical protein [Pontibacter sp. BT731]